MQNSSLHSFSLRLHFHAQYLQNKAYKHLIAKIFPEQLGYLALFAPAYFPSASLGSAFTERGGEAKLPTRPRSAGAAPGTQRCPSGLPEPGAPTDTGLAPTWGCPRRLPGLPRAGGRRSRSCRHSHRRRGGRQRLKRPSCRRLSLRRLLSREVKAVPHRKGLGRRSRGGSAAGGR